MKPQTEIRDFRKVLEIAFANGKSIIVGGHAVNFWALLYLERIERELRQFRPFTSKDLDLYGDPQLLEDLQKNLGGLKRLSPPRSPVIGRIDLEIDGTKCIVEVLHGVHGLSPKELAKVQPPILEIDECKARVLDPMSLLKAKIHNAADIDQKERNDVRHVRIMLLCVREFLLDALEETKIGRLSQRELVNLLERVLSAISDPKARKAQELWGIDYHKVWPMDQLKASGFTKVINFLAHRLSSV